MDLYPAAVWFRINAAFIMAREMLARPGKA